jgi:hypothetical protein
LAAAKGLEGLARNDAKIGDAEVGMPVLAVALGLMGSAVLVRWCVREVHRVNAELDELRGRPATEGVDRGSLPTLKRDPHTGEYRPD